MGCAVVRRTRKWWIPHGGRARYQRIAFFPAYPVLFAGAGRVLGAGESPVAWYWTGVLLSSVLYVIALAYLWRFAMLKVSASEARWAVLFCAGYPFAIFFGLPYTESLFLLVAIAAFFHFERREYGVAMLWGIAAGLTRPNGSIVGLALFCWWLTREAPMAWRQRTMPWASLASALAPMVGVGLYSAFIYDLTGDALMWMWAQDRWGRPVQNPLDVLGSLALQLLRDPLTTIAQVPHDVLNAAAGVGTLAASPFIAKKLGWPYAVFTSVCVLLPLTVGGLMSLGRFTSVLFPVFVWLGSAVAGPSRAVMFSAFLALQAVVAALFFTWRPLF